MKKAGPRVSERAGPLEGSVVVGGLGLEITARQADAAASSEVDRRVEMGSGGQLRAAS